MNSNGSIHRPSQKQTRSTMVKHDPGARSIVTGYKLKPLNRNPLSTRRNKTETRSSPIAAPAVQLSSEQHLRFVAPAIVDCGHFSGRRHLMMAFVRRRSTLVRTPPPLRRRTPMTRKRQITQCAALAVSCDPDEHVRKAYNKRQHPEQMKCTASASADQQVDVALHLDEFFVGKQNQEIGRGKPVY
uniref:Uncharacterized protein n=1 Tax=Panagrellus redivivus TaxID=6233 RepID=A0A7E4VYP5_PANRE